MARNTYTFQEVEKHNTEDDCWIIVSNKVFDVTRFLEHHPGGQAMLLMATGKDATYDYEVVEHSRSAREKVNDFYIGDIDPSTLPKPKKDNTSLNNLLRLVFVIGVALLMYYLT